MITIGNKKCKTFAYLGGKYVKLKKGYIYENGEYKKIYSAGNIVTYNVDPGIVYTEEVDSDASCLSPTTFTPAKSGWTFKGWREDKTASDTVLTSKIMGDDPITLYAVFEKPVTVTYCNNSATATSTTKQMYCNNGAVLEPSFTLTQTAKSGWTARGWSNSTAGNGEIKYNNATAFTRDSNITLYGMYQTPVACTFASYNNTQTVNGTRYYNSNGNIVNASITVPTGAAMSGWTWRGWSAAGTTTGNAGVSYANGNVIIASDNATYYGLYQATVTCKFSSYNTSKSVSGTRYYNAAGNYTNASITAPTGTAMSGWTWRGWSAANTTTGNAAVAYANGGSITGLTTGYTYYGLYQATVTCTFKSYGNTQTASGTKYWSASGNSINASVKVPTGAAAINGWTWRGWSAANTTTGNAAVAYANGATISNLTTAYTYYGLYQVACNLYTVSNGSTKTNSGYRYYNAYGTYVNPSYTIAAPTRSGWTFKGWSASASSTTASYSAISNLSITTSTYLYAIWSAANTTGSVNFAYDQTRHFSNTETLGTILSSVDASKYSGITLTFSQVSVAANFRGAQIDVNVSDGTNKTRIGYGYQNWADPSVGYSNQGVVLSPTLTFSSNSGNKVIYLTSDCYTYGQAISTSSTGTVAVRGASYTLIGRTVVY